MNALLTQKEEMTVKEYQQELLQILNSELSPGEDQADRIANLVKKEILKRKRIRAGKIIEKYSQIVRDLSLEFRKQVDFRFKGDDLEVDQELMEQLAEPLENIFRNCLEHGIESPEEREQMEKPPRGVIEMSVEKDEEKLVITISDDGRGLSYPRIKEIARETGLLLDEDLDRLSKGEIERLILLPNISLADDFVCDEKRGMGLYPLLKKVNALSGEIDLENNPGKGLKIRITIPTTIQILHVLQVKIYGKTFKIPLDSIN